MKLFATPDNPPPPGALASEIVTKDGVALRVARWSAGRTSRGTVAVLPGRAEFIEKYFETVGELLERRFDVVVMDWRGQGLSQRQLRNPRKGHIDDFDLYQLDLDALTEAVLVPFCTRPWFALGHSMGGANLLVQAHARTTPFARVVLTTPMIALAGLRFQKTSALLAEALDIIGMGSAYIPGGSGRSAYLRPFAGNALTSDLVRYKRVAAVVRVAPDVAVGDPTISWTNAAFHLMQRFGDADFARRTLTPILVIAAGADRITSTPAIEDFATRLKAGRVITLPYAEHEILTECDDIRGQFWAAFDSFIPGLEDRGAQSAPAHAPTGRQRMPWPWRKFTTKIRLRSLNLRGAPAPSHESGDRRRQ